MVAFCRAQGFKLILGIDVTHASNDALLDPIRDLIWIVELHNEPSIKPWYLPDYYKWCNRQMDSLEGLGLTFALNYHTPADKAFYEKDSPAKRRAWVRAEFLSPHLYGIDDLSYYKRFEKPLVVTEYHPLNIRKKRPDWWRALLTWYQLRLFNRNPLIEGIFFHHAQRYFIYENTPGGNQFRKLTARVHRRSARRNGGD